MLESDTQPRGLSPLGATLEPWMSASLNGSLLPAAIDRFGSPLNVIDTDPFFRNIRELQTVAREARIDLEIFFARKANKCLAFVDASQQAGIGVDVASEQELQQVLEAGCIPEKIICTAAVKSSSLVELCSLHRVPITIDSADELALVRTCSTPPPIVLRVSGFEVEGKKLHSRFGVDVDEILRFLQTNPAPPICGLHFHLDGYCPRQRVAAIASCLNLLPSLKELGHQIRFIDAGGGFPISYLESESEWSDFWREHDRALLGEREPLTYRNHGLGRIVNDGKIVGTPRSYPFFQKLTRADWLRTILNSEIPNKSGRTIAGELKHNNITLHCEPGRALLDGCGITIARVEFVKPHHDGYHFVGVAMNRTQCRTSSDDFLVDPLLKKNSPAGDAIEGYLVGTYCTESELICLRRLKFPAGIARGDLIAIPNTAGYFMHFLESRSHQFPLAQNLVHSGEELELDGIDS